MENNIWKVVTGESNEYVIISIDEYERLKHLTLINKKHLECS